MSADFLPEPTRDRRDWLTPTTMNEPARAYPLEPIDIGYLSPREEELLWLDTRQLVDEPSASRFTEVSRRPPAHQADPAVVIAMVMVVLVSMVAIVAIVAVFGLAAGT